MTKRSLSPIILKYFPLKSAAGANLFWARRASLYTWCALPVTGDTAAKKLTHKDQNIGLSGTCHSSNSVLGLIVTKIVCFGSQIITNSYLLSTSITIILILSVLIYLLHSGIIRNCWNISDHFRAVSHFFNSSPRISEPRHGSISIKLMNSAGTRPRLGVSISTCLVSQG